MCDLTMKTWQIGSAEGLDKLGDPGYVKIFLRAIERSTHMVGVTSDADHISFDLNPRAKWVEEDRLIACLPLDRPKHRSDHFRNGSR